MLFTCIRLALDEKQKQLTVMEEVMKDLAEERNVSSLTKTVGKNVLSFYS